MMNVSITDSIMTVATLVSRLLDPMGVIPAVTILGAERMGIHDFALWRMIGIIALVMVGPPLYLRRRLAKERGTGGWDIRNRAHRPKAIAALLLFGILNIILARVFGNASLGTLFIFYELWLVGFLVISLFWKISGHAGGIALAAGLIIRWYGWTWWPVVLLVPVMAWARVVTRDHTVGQVLTGVIYSLFLIIISNKFLI